MVTKQRAKEQIGFEDEAFDTVREFLANFGISPRPVDEHVEEDVAKAIHHRGWEYLIDRSEDRSGWIAELSEVPTATHARTAVGQDPSRVMALLRALRVAITWMSPEDQWQIFDSYARELLGMSGAEFLERLKSGELSPEDDSRVFHLTIMRPLGT
jgi:hypothetical protein